MWMLSNLDQFKRVASWVSTFGIFAALFSFGAAMLLETHRNFRICVALLVLSLALLVKHAVRNFDVNSQKSIKTIERVFYLFFALGAVSGIYIVGSERDLRSAPGLFLVSLNLVIGCFAFLLIKRNISNAKSFKPRAE